MLSYVILFFFFFSCPWGCCPTFDVVGGIFLGGDCDFVQCRESESIAIFFSQTA